MYVVVGLLVIGIVLNLTPLGRKGRNLQRNYWATRKIELDDYDEEQKNIDKLMR